MDARVQKMINLWVWCCSEANIGYDQWNRWDFPKLYDTQYSGECDCSSLMYWCAVQAGFNLPTSGTRYTGTMKRDFQAAGFKWVACSNATDAPVGAILWKSSHTAGWTGKYICEAYSDEKGGDHGGRDGDQANETRLSPPRAGWEGYFYWPETIKPVVWPQEVEPMPAGEAKDYIIEEGSNNVAHQNQQDKYFYRYEKWASGKLVCYVSDYFDGGNGTKYGGVTDTKMFFLDKVLNFPEVYGGPAFVEVPHITYSVRGNWGWAEIQFHNIAKNKAPFYLFSAAKNIPRTSVDATLTGSWK